MTDPLSYYIGLDLGQSHDYTAISIVEEPVWVGPVSEQRLVVPRSGWISPEELDPYLYWEACEDVEEYGRPPNPPLHVGHLERLPLGTPYPAVVERIKEFARTPPLSQFPTCLVAAAAIAFMNPLSYGSISPQSAVGHR